MQSIFTRFRNTLRDYGLQYFGRYYGFYPAVVADNADPQQAGRLRCECPALWATVPEMWIPPVGAYAAQGHGSLNVPAVGDRVYLRFSEGDASFPYYERANYADGHLPDALKADYPETIGMVDRGGLTLTHNRKTNASKLEQPDVVVLEADPETVRLQLLGDVILTVTADELSLETGNGKIFLGPQGYTLEDAAGNELGALLQDLTTAMTTMTVPTPMGPSGVPVNLPDFQVVLTKLQQLFA